MIFLFGEYKNMKKEIKNKNKVIPEICNRESQPYEKAKRLISPTETLGDDGWRDSWDEGMCMAEVPNYNLRERAYIKAFTLIELLVVVLIIGILSAVALPQYQKAVEKARMTEAVMAVEKIAQANQLYKIANGSFTRNITDLDIDYPGESTPYCGTINGIKTTNYTLTASNCSGDQYLIALAIRYNNSGDIQYSIAIGTNLARECNLYSDAFEYQRKLCQEWAAGN